MEETGFVFVIVRVISWISGCVQALDPRNHTKPHERPRRGVN